MTEDRETEQTAVAEEPNVEANQPSTATDSGAAQEDGLDALLKEFDDRQEAAAAPKEPVPASEPKPEQIDANVLATLEQRLNQQEAREQRRDLEKMLDRFTDGVQADAVEAEAFLIAMAKREPKIERAYMARGQNPKQWNDIESALKREFTKRWGKKVDKQVTESRDAVSAAVRSASTAAPQRDFTSQDIIDASKEDFDAMQRKLGVTPV